MNPPDLQPADTVEKRRKQIEKAKAAHLSRQLQTRLQYARLKVDHGWQKQTLNEVENLYFHHYRARIPSKSTRKSEKKSAGSLSAQRPSEHPTAAATSATASAPLTRHIDQQREPSSSAAAQLSAVAVPGEGDSSQMEVDPPADPPTSLAATEPTGSAVTATRPPPHNPASPVATPPTPRPPASSIPLSPAKTPSLPPPNPQTRHSPVYAPISQTPPQSVVSPPPPSRKPPLPRNSSLPQSSSSSMRSRGPSPAMRSLQSTNPSSMPGSSNVALTYDSFWSSHSTASNNYRSTVASAATYPTIGKGDPSAALSNLGPSYSFSMGAPSAPFQPLPLPKRPTVARKPTVPAAATAAGVRHGLSGGAGGG